MCNGLCQMQNDWNFIWRYQNWNLNCISLSTFAYEHLDIHFWSFRLVFVVFACVRFVGLESITHFDCYMSTFHIRPFSFYSISLFREFARRNRKKKHQESRMKLIRCICVSRNNKREWIWQKNVYRLSAIAICSDIYQFVDEIDFYGFDLWSM